MHPFCEATGVGVLPWSPLARGKVTRPWGESGSGSRARTDEYAKNLYKQDEESNKAIVDTVAEIASARGVPMAQVALAWVVGKSAVTAPIVGATKVHHIDDAVAALDLDLAEDEVQRLEAAYSARRASEV
jgi:aryl-alcohol dehydrogenase-like predicted oxidoreductase